MTAVTRNVALHLGDNLEVMASLAQDPAVKGQVDLVYLDPPYGTGRDFEAFDDRWADGRAGLATFLSARFDQIYPLLSDEGSILVHVDPRIVHHVAIALDALFGPGDRDPRKGDRPGFRNEIIWVYGLGGSSKTRWPRKHDVILWYTKGSRWFFQPPRTPATSARMKGRDKKQPDVLFGLEAVQAGEIDQAGDVLEVPTLNNMAHERTGYPTQKPMALLELLVRAHCPPGGLVMDPFCGSGTSLVAAAKLGCNVLGIDQHEPAVELTRKRLQALAVELPE